MSELHDTITRLLDEMDVLKGMLKHERLERAQEIAAAIESWKDVVRRQKAEAVKWHGRYAIVKAENNALRRKPDNRERKDMALLIAKLARALEKANTDSDLPAKASDYLRRKDMLSPLRRGGDDD